MKLCIPVNAPKGLESLLQSHLPSAEHLPFSDTETRLREDKRYVAIRRGLLTISKFTPCCAAASIASLCEL